PAMACSAAGYQQTASRARFAVVGDEEASPSLYQTRADRLTSPPTGNIAIKVINHNGDEMLKALPELCPWARLSRRPRLPRLQAGPGSRRSPRGGRLASSLRRRRWKRRNRREVFVDRKDIAIGQVLEDWPRHDLQQSTM